MTGPGLLLVAISLLAFASKNNGDKAADFIDNLPGLTFDPGFKQYSGFLPTKAGDYLHYWFVESQNNPSTDPLIVWFNGGPGCSSVGGFLTELGPFRVNPDGVTLFENIYSWNKVANVIFLEAPRGVGYSYRDPSLTPDNLYNDEKSAADNADAILEFINRFPEYKDREFYVTGESYGGVYVPTLSKLLVERIQAGKMPGLNFKGFAVGNGMLSEKEQINSVIDILYYRGIYGMREFEKLKPCCTSSSKLPLAYCDFAQYVTVSSGNIISPKHFDNKTLQECANLVTEYSFNGLWGTLNDPYNTYQDCYADPASTPSLKAMRQSKLHRRKKMQTANFRPQSKMQTFISDGRNPFVDQGSKINIDSTDAQEGFPCWMEGATQNYMNLPQVRNALHIPNWLPAWSDCNDTVGELYNWQTMDDTPVFQSMFKSGYPLRILVYNGDLDTACNFLGDEWFTTKLAKSNGFQGTPRTDWEFAESDEYASSTAGYQKRFKKGKYSLDYLTVKGAGHFVPLDRAGPSLQMITNFLKNRNYNALIPVSTKPKPLLAQYQPPSPPVYTRKEADRVWYLPGLTFRVNFKQYSGYLRATTGNYLHYWFTESQRNPLTDPLVLWLNGGPGCSSLGGLLSELGPYWINPDGATFTENAFSWNKFANVLFLESPRNVGFSYQNMSENQESKYNDELTARDNFLAVMDFLTVYPEYINRDFYVSGESYGGVYVPTLVSLMIDEIQAGRAPGLNLVGMSVGNGELSSKYLFNSIPFLLYNRAMYGVDTMEFLESCCPNKSEPLQDCDLSKYVTFDSHGGAQPIDNTKCSQLLPEIAGYIIWELAEIQDVYNMYEDCYMNREYVFGSRFMQKYRRNRILPKMKAQGVKGFVDQLAKINFKSTDSQGAFMCYSFNALTQYLSMDDVRAALHIPPEVAQWSVCNDVINFNYVHQHNDVMPVFEHIIQSGHKIHILVYNGDLDTACNFMGDEWFIDELAKKLSMKETVHRQPWIYERQNAGYFVTYDYQSSVKLDLLTVKGAGHMVPTDRPGPAQQMYQDFLQNTNYSMPVTVSTNRVPLKPQYQVQIEIAATQTGNPPIQVARFMSKRKPKRHIKWEPQQPKSRAPAPPLGSKKADRITSLPGATFPIKFNQYSGYLNATPGNYLHYWFVESQNDPTKDPLVLWFNGGPGCSSLGGLIEELGPFYPNPDGKTLFENQFSWNKFANVIFLESPRDVGFSYRSSDAQPDDVWNDDKTALDNVLAIKSFYERFPEYKDRDFYISGESYAGIYIPTLTDLLIKYIRKDMKYVNLKGLAIGNGELSAVEQIRSAPELLYYRGVIGKHEFDRLKPCCMVNGVYQNQCDLTQYITFDQWGNANAKGSSDPIANECGKLVQEIGFNMIWGTLNDVYNTYQDCYNTSLIPTSRHKRSVPSYGGIPMTNNYTFIDQGSRVNVRSTDAYWAFPCYNDYATQKYLNLPEVRSAIHIPKDVIQWTDCSDAVGNGYNQTHHDTTPVFKSIIDSKYPLRILIYNGDADTACNFLGDEWFVEKLAKSYKMKAGQRDAWNYTFASEYLPRIGGYIKKFEHGKDLSIDLLTIKGAGHMVPMDRPGPALQMISNFIFKRPYSTIVPYNVTLQPLIEPYQPQPAPTVPRKVANKVYELPGLTYNINFNHYSGYLKSSPGNYLHYWFVESQGQPANDPVIVWLNGGPGCSSLSGLLTELGPFRPNPDGRTLFENVFSWNKAANIIFLESPRMVGFSYQDKSVNPDNVWNDNKTAEENANALEDFFTVFPDYLENDFYISGESYAGVYVPTLAAVLIDRIMQGRSQINLRGVAVGNGALSLLNEVRADADFMYFHGIYGVDQWDELIKCCPNYGPKGSEPPLVCNYAKYVQSNHQGGVTAVNFTNESDTKCSHLVAKLSEDKVWDTINDVYNLYQDCYHDSARSSEATSKTMAQHLKMLKTKIIRELLQSPRNYKSAYSKISVAYVNTVSTDAAGGFPCYMDGAMAQYLNQVHVRKALNIPDYVQPWEDCSDLVFNTYYQSVNDTTPVFQRIIDSAYPMRILIYAGDVDSACNIFESEYTVEALAKANKMKASEHKPWYYKLAPQYSPVIGGYQKHFSKGSVNIDLLTVKGAGHFVPTDRPGPALQMITNFLRDTGNYSLMAPFSIQRQPLLPQYQQVTPEPSTPKPTSSPLYTSTTIEQSTSMTKTSTPPVTPLETVKPSTQTTEESTTTKTKGAEGKTISSLLTVIFLLLVSQTLR